MKCNELMVGDWIADALGIIPSDVIVGNAILCHTSMVE